MSSSAESMASVRVPRIAAGASFVEPNVGPVSELFHRSLVVPFVTAECIIRSH